MGFEPIRDNVGKIFNKEYNIIIKLWEPFYNFCNYIGEEVKI